MALLDVQNLTTKIPTPRGTLTVVDDVSFTVERGECFGLVGESGSGKSMTVRSILGLVPHRRSASRREPSSTTAPTSPACPTRDLNAIRGRTIATIVQDAVSALNPVYRIGRQIAEPMLEHGVAKNPSAARTRAIALMAKVGIPAPEKRIDDFPHQFSGGMCQRVVIATALACDPGLILADEPTTALDVTIQDQILKLLVALQRDLGLSLLLVTHDMGVVAQTCQRVAVMYAGQIVELVATEELFRDAASPLHRRPAELRAPARRPGATAEPDPRGAPRPGRAALGLPLPSALPAGDGRLPQRAAAADRGCSGSLHPLPPPRRDDARPVGAHRCLNRCCT